MTLPFEGKKVPSRLLGLREGRRLFGAACGGTACGGRMHGRLLGGRDGVRLFGVASECCQPPADPPADPDLDLACWDAEKYYEALQTRPFMVETGRWPGGLSRVIRVRVEEVTRCPEFGCKFAFLVYREQGEAAGTDGTAETAGVGPCDIPAGRGHWYGCVANVETWLWVDETKPPGERVRVCFGACAAPDLIDIDPRRPERYVELTDAGCYIVRGRVENLGGGDSCCECESPLYHLSFLSYCGPRHAGRFVGYRGGTKVFAVGGCCPPDPCSPSGCCPDRDRPMPRTLNFSAFGSGNCPFEFHSTMTYSCCFPANPLGVGCWAGEAQTVNFGDGCSITVRPFLAACSAWPADTLDHAGTVVGGNPSCPSGFGEEGEVPCGPTEAAWNLLIEYSSVESGGLPGFCPCGVRVQGDRWFCVPCLDSNPDFSCDPIVLTGSFSPWMVGVFFDDLGVYDCEEPTSCDFQVVITEGAGTDG